LLALLKECSDRLVKKLSIQGRESKGKGKSVPLQAWSGPEGSRKLRLSTSMTFMPTVELNSSYLITFYCYVVKNRK